jgi:hypothetical protein
MTKKTHHVSLDPDGRWKVQREGASYPAAHTRTKVEAVRIGKVISLRSGSNLIIHEEGNHSNIK